jgi:hypothetical protein
MLTVQYESESEFSDVTVNSVIFSSDDSDDEIRCPPDLVKLSAINTTKNSRFNRVQFTRTICKSLFLSSIVFNLVAAHGTHCLLP